jgi:hypothetical protein
MKAGEICKMSGYYLCLYHLKHKIKISKGDTFQRCDFAGLRCEGFWSLKKEVIEKTQEEMIKAYHHKRELQDRRKNFDKETRRKMKEPKFNKWDFEKW